MNWELWTLVGVTVGILAIAAGLVTWIFLNPPGKDRGK